MYNPKEIEPRILEFWEKNKIYEKAKAKNKGKKQFYYLDGPPYTSGRIHVGHAWGKALRDSVMRFLRMKGLDVWDRPSFDMHGMPIENKVAEKLGLNRKEDVEKYGIERFQKECEKFSIDNMNLMINDFKRLGVWMEWSNPYTPLTKSSFDGEWWLIKQADKNKRLYLGKKVMHWCAKCETSLAKHELDYENVKDNSIFLKFKVNKSNEYLIIFTTTPWTVPFNLAVMANPNFDYVKAETNNEVWIMAEGLVKSVEGVTGKKFKIIDKFKGSKLKGLRYTHPFEKETNFPKSRNLHTVVLSKEYVTLDTGSGLVHCAPGCGPEDYEVGHKEGLSAFNEVDDNGKFSNKMGMFSGFVARRDDSKIIDELDKNGSLIVATKIEHEYPHCWRCHNPVIFRTTEQWFFRIEDMIDKMRKLNKRVKWVPEWAGNKWFDSWLCNLRDNGITRQKYWGTPAPIWKCDKCRDYLVVGSVDELKRLAGKLPENLHKPWIDKVIIKCKCGGVKRRIPDILDVWIDAGTLSWNCLDYPGRTDLFKELYPADLILEGKDQIRGWFSLLLITSMIAMKKHSYKTVYMHGFVQDALGRKMSKSLGNVISPYEIIDNYGSDALRYYMIGGANPGIDINYNMEDMKVKYKNLNILWNLHNYLIEYSKGIKLIKSFSKKDLGTEEIYILSKLNNTLKKTTELFDNYHLDEIPIAIEKLFLELSRFYIQLIRDKTVFGNKREKEVILYAIYNVLLNTLKILAPIAPFITEEIYQNLRKEFKLKEESIHLFDWPKYDKELIDEELERSVDATSKIIQMILAEREKAKLGMRWPLSRTKITIENVNSIKKLQDLIKVQANVKEVEFKKGKLNVEVDTRLTPELEQEGYARELMRKIQTLRKKEGLKKENLIELAIKSDYDLRKVKDDIKIKVNAKSLDFEKKGAYKVNVRERIRDQEFEISFNTIK